MAITNAQQFKQLVNPPMKGKKRPGYRGDDAYGGGDSVAGGGDQGNVGGNRDAREIGARMSRTQAMARANQRALAALGDPDPEVDVATKDRRDTITNFGKNLSANFRSSPFSIGPLGLLKTINQTRKARNILDKIRDIQITPTDDDDTIPRGDGEYILPIFNMANIAKPTTPTVTNLDTTEDETKDFVNRFAPVTSLPFADYRGGIEVAAADGGRIGYAGGGITGLRQGYFLGKLVRKATKAVKKVVKSPVGKAALAYAAYNYGP